VLRAEKPRRGRASERGADVSQGGAEIFLALAVKTLLMGAKIGDPGLYFGSDVVSDDRPGEFEADLNGLDIVGLQIAGLNLPGRRDDFRSQHFCRGDAQGRDFDDIQRYGLKRRRCLNAHTCLGVCTGVRLLASDRLNKRQRLRDQKIAFLFPAHHATQPGYLGKGHREMQGRAVAGRPGRQV
jgi:hypothetical protein